MDNKQLEAMLQQAAAKLGTTTDQLKEMAVNGNLEKQLNNSVDASTGDLQKALSDPETAKKLLSSPQAQEIMRMLNKNKN